MDRLAAEGTLFEKAFCSVPVCGASRASLLTGVRPNRERFLNHMTWADHDLPGHLSLPRHFQQNGYYTVSLGKVYHHGQDDVSSWNEKRSVGGDWKGHQAYTTEASFEQMIPTPKANNKWEGRGPAWEVGEGDDSAYPDGKLADLAIKTLRQLAAREQPFFLATGFFKPHLPFNAPRKYWDLYQRDSLKLATNPEPPLEGPVAALHNSGELRRGYTGVPSSKPLPDDYALSLIHGYYACVSYVDAQIGRVMAELEALGLRDNTLVVLWGDHGWNLGEHTLWCKHSNFETSLRAPLIISGAGVNKGIELSQLVEFVDIYPTLADLCGLEVPPHCEGESLVPLLEEPSIEWKEAVFMRWLNGDTIRTQRYAYTEWKKSDQGEVYARMLYDLEADPQENINVAENPDYHEIRQTLSSRLQDGWQPVRVRLGLAGEAN